MVFDDEPPKNPKTLEKWSQQATTSAFGLMESLRGQGSSIAKNLKSFGKHLIKDSTSSSSGSKTPDEHRDDDIRLAWLTNRIVIADTLHTSKEGLLKAEKAVVREMIDCQPYVVVNVHPEPLRLDGYAKSIHVPLGCSQKGGLAHQPTIRSMIPILNEYCLLTNDAAIVIFGQDENVVVTAAFCLVASRSLSRVPDFLRDSLQIRYENLPTTYKIFIQQTQNVVKMLSRNERPSIGLILNAICLEPGNALIDGELFVAIIQAVDQIKVFEFSANQCRDRSGQIIFNLDQFEVLDDVTICVGQKNNVKHPLLTAKFNTQLLSSDDTDIVLTPNEMDVSRIISQPVQDLRMIVNFATRRAPTLNALNFDRYKLLCVRNEKELDGFQRTYGSVDSEDESPILRSGGRKNYEEAPGSSFFDTLEFNDSGNSKGERLLDDDDLAKTSDLLGGFSVGDDASANRNDFDLIGQTQSTNLFDSFNETPILSAPTPVTSEIEMKRSSPAPAIDDLLGLGSNLSSNSQATSQSNSANNLVDFDFGEPLKPTNSNANLRSSPVVPPPSQPATQNWSNTDLLGGFSPLKPMSSSTPPNSMNSSAANSNPVSHANSQSDFEAFLSNYPEKNSGPTTKSAQPPTRTNVPKQQYKPAFGDPNPATGAKAASDTFSNLLNHAGFKATARENQKQSIGDLLKKEQAKNLTPEEIKIRDWTQGKERNIRALLGSLHNVLWEGAGNWKQPSMGELLSADQIKKHYRKACLVVHPDKLTGSPHLELAKMIFTELNDAYSKHTNDPNAT